MTSFVSLLSLSLSLLPSIVTAIASPESIESDLSIISHNDLYYNLTSRGAASIVLATPFTYATASTKCAALGTVLWNPDEHTQDLGYLRYLDYNKTTGEVGIYWVEGNSTTHCKTITTHGDPEYYPCDMEFPVLCSNTEPEQDRNVAAKTGNATLVGRRIQGDSSFRFLGVKYATVPARFSPSIYLPPSGSNISALEYGSSCLQGPCRDTSLVCSEDCFYLNIWTPYLPNGKVPPAKKKAVMLWLHGGGFFSGTASDTTFDGNSLASRGDVVVISMNYRLATFGFLALENTTLTGNYALHDVNAALDWLDAHVADFGGDKDRITIFGQSAGAAAVRGLLASPVTRNRFRGAIMMSTPVGLGYAAPFSHYRNISQATELWREVVSDTGCTQRGEELVDCLRNIDAMELLKNDLLVVYASYPVLHPTLLPSDLDLRSNSTQPRLNVTLLTGTMRDDGSVFADIDTPTNLSDYLTSQGLLPNSISRILNSSAFSIPQTEDGNNTLAVFNLTSEILTKAYFTCLTHATAQSSNIFPNTYTYTFHRSYQLSAYSPNAPLCEAPITPEHPYGDTSKPYFRCHSGELYYVFGSLIKEGRMPRDEDDIPFAQYAVDTWSAFARTGSPNLDQGFLEARGFANSSRLVQMAGEWLGVGDGAGEGTVKRLSERPGNMEWDGKRECEALGLGEDFFANCPGEKCAWRDLVGW